MLMQWANYNQDKGNTAANLWKHAGKTELIDFID